MVVLISALFMIFYIGGFITALYVMKFAKKYFNNQHKEESSEIKGTTTNDTQDLISEWLYGEPRQNKGGDINE